MLGKFDIPTINFTTPTVWDEETRPFSQVKKKTGHSKTPKHLCEDPASQGSPLYVLASRLMAKFTRVNTHVGQAHYARRFLMEIIAETGGYNNPVRQYAPRTDPFFVKHVASFIFSVPMKLLDTLVSLHTIVQNDWDHDT